jgi:hypothetical protein
VSHLVAVLQAAAHTPFVAAGMSGAPRVALLKDRVVGLLKHPPTLAAVLQAVAHVPSGVAAGAVLLL